MSAKDATMSAEDATRTAKAATSAADAGRVAAALRYTIAAHKYPQPPHPATLRKPPPLSSRVFNINTQIIIFGKKCGVPLEA